MQPFASDFMLHYKWKIELCSHPFFYVPIKSWFAIVPNPEEIAELKWMKTADIETDMRQSPSSYTKWFITAFPIVLNHLKDF